MNYGFRNRERLMSDDAGEDGARLSRRRLLAGSGLALGVAAIAAVNPAAGLWRGARR